jgi:hypothetical protein
MFILKILIQVLCIQSLNMDFYYRDHNGTNKQAKKINLTHFNWKPPFNESPDLVKYILIPQKFIK